MNVHFSVSDGVPSGMVSLDSNVEPQHFSSEESFKRVMQDVMLPQLGLEPIPATRVTGSDKDVVRYEDGWLAYTGAFLSDAKSNAVIGEHIPNTDITQRFLQVFLGIPWATTFFQARSALRVLESELAQRKRKMQSLGGQTIEDMEAELAAIELQIFDEAARDAVIARVVSTQRELNTLQERVGALRVRLSEFEMLVEESKDGRTRAERVVLDIDEEHRSAAFFKQLEPVECPRCSTKITNERRKLEAASRQCSVCAVVAEAPDPGVLAAQRAEAQSVLEERERQLQNAEDARSKNAVRLAETIAQRDKIGSRLSEESKLGTAVDVQTLERRHERLEGMLQIARAVIGEAGDSGDAIEIVRAAHAESEQRTKDAASAVLDRVSKEITRIVRALGATAVDDVTLNRAAITKVTKGGVITSFSHLSDGEQLRLRIATVLALVNTAKAQKVGRHPGLLIIDSPGNAEMKGENVANVIREIEDAVKAVEDVQVIVGMRGVELARSIVPPSRVIGAGDGAKLW